jgi:hypothetical protein
MALSKIESQALDVGQIGGRRNLIINGAMQVAQRGTSKSNPSGGYDTVDRFRVEGRTGQGGASTATQESFTPAASYPELLKNYFQLAITTTPSSNPMHIEQRIEDCVTGNGQEVTLSFWGRVTSGTYDVTTNYENNSGGSGGTVQGSSAHTLTTTWTRFTETVTLPTVSSGTTGSSTYLKVQILFPIASGTNTVQITGVQLEVGSVATPFEHRSYGEELALCQRYYYQWNTNEQFNAIAVGMAEQSNELRWVIPFHTEMRAKPSQSLSAAGDFTAWDASHSSDLNTRLAYYAGKNSAFIRYSANTSGFTIGRALVLYAASNANAAMKFDAEL